MFAGNKAHLGRLGTGPGPNPTAIRTGKPCVLRNILTDPDYSSWREECIKRGYASIIVHSTIELAPQSGPRNDCRRRENQEIWERLTKLGCDFAQGYFISKPIPADEFEDWKDHSRWAVKSLRPLTQ